MRCEVDKQVSLEAFVVNDFSFFISLLLMATLVAAIVKFRNTFEVAVATVRLKSSTRMEAECDPRSASIRRSTPSSSLSSTMLEPSLCARRRYKRCCE